MKKPLLIPFSVVAKIFMKILSTFVIFSLIWSYVFKEKCVSAHHSILAYVDFTSICFVRDHSLIQIRSYKDRKEIRHTHVSVPRAISDPLMGRLVPHTTSSAGASLYLPLSPSRS